MKLNDLIKNLDYKELVNFENAVDIDISGISYNSKTTKSGDIFVCLVGEYSDGHDYFEGALGALALMVEHKVNSKLPQIIVESTRHQIADIASTFYDFPTQNLNLIGVTGTNGKTTVTHLIQNILEADKQKCALIGTLGYKLTSQSEYKEAKHTTPQAPELQATMKMMEAQEIKNIAMEVSSHALEQNRVGGCRFKGAVLTNLTQDHLDYHITMDNYFEAKSMLFKNLQDGDFAVINADDDYAKRFVQSIKNNVKVFTYGIKNNCDFKATDVQFSLEGASLACATPIGEKRINLKMNGMFSVYNALCALATVYAMGVDIDLAILTLENTKGVAGRFEAVCTNPLVIVDYAHTPDGLENVLKAAREITPQDGKLICLFGCGGDRDATKRPKMGAIAENLADKVVITSDNPRSEDPQQIITDILTGLKSINQQKIFVEADRAKAIALIKTFAKENDVVLIAGKGHEDYQILKDKTIHFDDRQEARKVFDGITV